MGEDVETLEAVRGLVAEMEREIKARSRASELQAVIRFMRSRLNARQTAETAAIATLGGPDHPIDQEWQQLAEGLRKLAFAGVLRAL